MRAVRLHDRRDLRVDEVEEFPLREGYVRVDVAYTGICGSDLHEYESGPVPIRAEDSDHALPESEWDLPKWMGHEVAGTVSEVGAGVEDVAVGDRVALCLVADCGECRYCAEGKYNLCTALDGSVVDSPGFADNVVVPASMAVDVPDGLPLEHAALAEPLGVSLRGVTRSGVGVGDEVAVFGAGPIGLGVVAGAAAAGARTVYVSEPVRARREAAATLGADVTVDPAEEDPRERVRAETDGVDVAFETAGAERTLTDALRATKYDGTVVVLSVFEEAVTVHPHDIMQAERHVVGSFGFNGGPVADRSTFTAALELMADGRIDPEPFVTSTVDLDGTEAAFERLLEDGTEQVKVLVEP